MLSEHPSYHQNIFNILYAYTDNAIFDAGSMYHLTASDINAYVVSLAVMVVVNEDDIANLHAAETYFSAVRALHVRTVRKPDSVISPVAVHCKTGTVKTLR